MSSAKKAMTVLKGITDGIPLDFEGKTIFELQDMLKMIRKTAKTAYKDVKRLDRLETKYGGKKPEFDEVILMGNGDTEPDNVEKTAAETEPVQGTVMAITATDDKVWNFKVTAFFAKKLNGMEVVTSKILAQSEKAYKTTAGWIPKSQILEQKEVA